MGTFNLEEFIAKIPEGKGSLNKNGYKKTELQPDFRGFCRLNGQVYEMGGWLKDTANGSKRMALSLKPYTAESKTAQYEANKQNPTTPKAKYADDDIPFF
jgi:hypothetical protein